MQRNYKKSLYDRNQEVVKSCFNNVTDSQFKDWRWESEDDTFLPHEVEDAEEIWGVPIEFTPPDPPKLRGVPGLKTAAEAVAGLAAVGLQSSPRQSLDVHLMLRGGPGHDWTDHDLALFFAGYARAQYALDFVTPSGRVNQYGGSGLYLWDPKVQYVFRNLHRLVRTTPPKRVSDPQWLCDAILGKGECDIKSPYWPAKHTPLRHYAINFATIFKFRSIELRGYGSTNNPEHVARWVDLTLRMAKHFREDKALMTFFDENEEDDLKQLHAAQESRSLAQVFDDVGLPQSSRDFYLRQSWAKTENGATWGPNCVNDLDGHRQHGNHTELSGAQEVAVQPKALLERRHGGTGHIRGHGQRRGGNEAGKTLEANNA